MCACIKYTHQSINIESVRIKVRCIEPSTVASWSTTTTTMTSSDGALFKLKKTNSRSHTDCIWHQICILKSAYKISLKWAIFSSIHTKPFKNYLCPNFTLQCNYQSIFQHMYVLDILLTSEPLKLNANLFCFVENVFGNEAMALIYPRTCTPISTEHHLKIAWIATHNATAIPHDIQIRHYQSIWCNHCLHFIFICQTNFNYTPLLFTAYSAIMMRKQVK